MDRKLIDLFLKSLNSPSEALILTDIIVDTVSRAKLTAVKPLVSYIKKVIKDSSVRPKGKLHALTVLAKCMKTANEGLLLFAEKKILSRFSVLARHRKESKEESRGSTLFGDWTHDPEEAEASMFFFQLLLTSLQDWGQRYVRVKDSNFSRFYRVYQKLLGEGVTFPHLGNLQEYRSQAMRLLHLLDIPEADQGEIKELAARLNDFQRNLQSFKDQETNPGLKAQISECQETIEKALNVHRAVHKSMIKNVKQPGNFSTFPPPLQEPVPLSFPEAFFQEGIIIESDADEEDVERSSLDFQPTPMGEKLPFEEERKEEETDSFMKMEVELIDLRCEREDLKQTCVRLETENDRMRRELESLKRTLESESRSTKELQMRLNSMKESQVFSDSFSQPIANRSNFQLLSGKSKGTLYSDQFFDVLIDIKLSTDPQSCSGAFMLVLRSTVPQVLETAQLNPVPVSGVVCKAAKSLAPKDLSQNKYSDAQYKFRYTEITANSPLFSLSFVSAGLQYIYYIKLPLPMFRFAHQVSTDFQGVQQLWEELADSSIEIDLPSFDPLIQNVSSLVERIKMGGQMTAFAGAPLPSGNVLIAGSLLNQEILARLVVSPARTIRAEVRAKDAGLRRCFAQVITQLLEH